MTLGFASPECCVLAAACEAVCVTVAVRAVMVPVMNVALRALWGCCQRQGSRPHVHVGPHQLDMSQAAPGEVILLSNGLQHLSSHPGTHSTSHRSAHSSPAVERLLWCRG